MSGQSVREIDPLALKNGYYPHSTFGRPRRLRRRRLYLRIVDWGGALAVLILVGAMFVFAVAAFLGAWWLLLMALDALVRRLGG